MSFTVLYRSKRFRFIYSLSRRQLVAATVLVAGLIFMAGRSTHTPSDTQARIAFTQSGLIQQRQEVEVLKQNTEQQLTGMLMKLGEMQSQLQRLNALGEKLALESDLDVSEFNLEEPPAMGGPSAGNVDVTIESSKDVLQQIDSMLLVLDDKTQQLEALETIMLNHDINAEAYISGRPISSGWLSSYYGVRKDPFNGMPAMHKGLDFAGKMGSPVLATGAGLVTWSGQRYGFGNMIEIDHGDGLVTRYGHNQDLLVKVGDVVTKGQHIAAMGSSGRSTGSHVHYEVLKHGKQLDPLQYVYRESAVN
ncbi:peptidoglycan DD-metalloendopeptidase family protein [Paraneptunicella aestuarii]|uniref:M23 family metallopeptidase n=1 Tax=Paraneptunicella aestuarii TaxID=2831148 RepID=UPI001E589CB3|nr:M23 family metallopeptidase [Paraneptunicella aestuarii]UAA38083.1 peptidoglycan DD-metalloendopeptidase family protein [Paraneptunicella aestuarii]